MINNSKYNKKLFLKIFFLFLSFATIIKIYDNAVSYDAWQYGEWLINYQNGFVRRGLFGEIIYLFSKLFNNNIHIAFCIIISVVTIFYYFLSFQFVKNLKFNFVHYFILFSPLFYLFFIIVSKVGIKKEIIFYIYYLLYLTHLSYNNFTFQKNWKFIFIFPLILLIHEGLFFYLPYVVLPLLFLVNKKNLKNLFFQIAFLFIFSSLIMFLLYLNKGSLEHTINICQSLGNYKPMKCDWWGPIFALSHDVNVANDGSSNLFFYLTKDYKANIGFLFFIIYGFFPLFIYYNFARITNKKNFNNKKIIFIFFSLIFIFSFPLFHLAEDWTRWLSIHFHLIIFFTLFLQRMNIIKYSFISNKIYFYNYVNKKKLMNLSFIFLFLYATSFTHPHFFFKGVRLEFTYYKILKKIEYLY